MIGRFVTGFGVFAFLVVSSSSAEAQSKDLSAKGRAIYEAQKCSLCHSIEGKGQAKGPLDYVGDKLKADDIRKWLMDPTQAAKDHNATRKPAMKAYSNLPKEDLEALIAYMLSLKKK
ncbi:MAG TPA: cytochrome c [Vicinamibacterales bacterium]|nr:cytochrome c [Vicinamibacterales bacterium]